MAYKKEELIEQSLKAIQENNLVFIDDVVSFLPCSSRTFYNKELHKDKEIIDAINKNHFNKADRNKIRRKHNGSGYVYFINCVGTRFYKIGISKIHPDLRISTLQSGCPLELKLIEIRYCNNYKEKEAELHSKYRSKNVRGEWFSFNDIELIDFLKEFRNIEKQTQLEFTLN